MFSYQPWTRDGFDAGLRMISIRTIAGNDGFMAPAPSVRPPRARWAPRARMFSFICEPLASGTASQAQGSPRHWVSW